MENDSMTTGSTDPIDPQAGDALDQTSTDHLDAPIVDPLAGDPAPIETDDSKSAIEPTDPDDGRADDEPIDGQQAVNDAAHERDPEGGPAAIQPEPGSGPEEVTTENPYGSPGFGTAGKFPTPQDELDDADDEPTQ